ncbi:MAG TPA: HD domain-containing protein [Candidatus Paceibacterota bacterium]|nr:HD domain-containing protein [Candidatus Paceibacterota bacterium]
MRLLHDVERVKRVARRPDEREMTNTAEHTFELALVCWYIIAVNKLNLDLEKVLRYALAHDVIEAYAGDTPAYDKEMQKTKAAREHAALERIEKEFPEFQDFTSVIHEYESRATPEARFVYATDKIVDPVNASMEETQSIWKEFNISLETLVAHKNPKVALSEHVVPLWDELVRKLETKRGFFFHS